MDYNKIIFQWKEFKIPKTLQRDVSINLRTNFITAIIGPRRAGKTYLCFQEIKKLINKKISKENILYINFEDEKLLNANAKDIDNLLNAFYELSDVNTKQKIYLFLDEIQNVKNWDVWVRRIHDMNKNIKIILTGSSSKMLSNELSTKLRGRVINVLVFPLSFKEYLNWRNINYNYKTVSFSKDRFAVKKAFLSYFSNGGYPSLIIDKSAPQEMVLQNYFQSMIFKDVIERYDVKEIKKLQILAKLIFESIAGEISYNKLTNKLKSLGFNISKNTVINYITYFEDAYLFFQNMKYEYSLTKQLGSIKKIYCIDNGLLNAVTFKFSDNMGRLLENLVFIELKRKNKNIFYYKGKNECDFVIKEKNKIISAIQVSDHLDENNKKREINGLLNAMNTFDLKKGIILTRDTENKFIIGTKEINVIPIWKWLLK